MQPFGRNKHGQKIGDSAPFLGKGLGPNLTPSPLRWGLPPYKVASWCIQPFGHNRNGPKIWGAPHHFGDGLGPHLTQSCLGWGLPPYKWILAYFASYFLTASRLIWSLFNSTNQPASSCFSSHPCTAFIRSWLISCSTLSTCICMFIHGATFSLSRHRENE